MRVVLIKCSGSIYIASTKVRDPLHRQALMSLSNGADKKNMYLLITPPHPQCAMYSKHAAYLIPPNEMPRVRVSRKKETRESPNKKTARLASNILPQFYAYHFLCPGNPIQATQPNPLPPIADSITIPSFHISIIPLSNQFDV